MPMLVAEKRYQIGPICSGMIYEYLRGRTLRRVTDAAVGCCHVGAFSRTMTCSSSTCMHAGACRLACGELGEGNQGKREIEQRGEMWEKGKSGKHLEIRRTAHV